MNVITAKAILGELLEAYDECEHGDYFYDNGDVVCDAVECILEEPRWISVKERLPEDEKPVLAYYGFDNEGDGDLGMMFTGTLSYFCFDPDPHWQHASCNLVVTHWMPLPEPPEVEG